MEYDDKKIKSNKDTTFYIELSNSIKNNTTQLPPNVYDNFAKIFKRIK